MEGKITKEHIENILEKEITTSEFAKNYLVQRDQINSRLNIQKELLKNRLNLLPLNTDLLLKHWDILLETTKSIFLACSTIFVASIALNTSNMLSINIPIVIKFSIFGFISSMAAGSYILYKRNKEKKEIFRKLTFLDDRYTELTYLEDDNTTLDDRYLKEIEDMKEKARILIRKDEKIKKHLPDNF